MTDAEFDQRTQTMLEEIAEQRAAVRFLNWYARRCFAIALINAAAALGVVIWLVSIR
jgi:delta 1-pyrroline-5-carboxylate dehydrogenase